MCDHDVVMTVESSVCILEAQ